ncbi:MAG TPA: glycosyltransferase family 39 protein, partial [Acetobacteraceae bacterium]|nr:glycosyltransferase family 39 protein [Acetobacteraceae bacterium]
MSRPVKWACIGLAVLTLIRLLVASVAPLAPDEAYYWVWSHALAAGYLDHPPMVALWIRVGTSLAGADAIGVRLLGPLAAAVGSVLLYDTAERLFPARGAGLTAAALLNATLILGAGSEIMTPDTPLLLFWTATLWAGARLASGGAPAWWLACGIFAGLAMVSKYTGAFLPLGLGLFAAIAMPRSLRRPEPWLGGLIAGLVMLPVVLWNAQHDWVGFLRQGGRVADWRPERAAQFLGELVGGQIGLATPGVFVLVCVGIVTAIRMTARSRDPSWTLLSALSVPPVLVFLQHAIGDRVEGNWPAIIYPAGAVAAAGITGSTWRRWTWPSFVLGVVIA